MNGSRRKWKRSVATLFFVLAVALTGCQRLVEPEKQSISVYVTFWPVYALTDAVMAEVPDATLRLLVQPQDGCLRNYQLSDWDTALLSRSADAVILGGRGLESFESTMFGWGDSGPAVTAVLYNLELYNQEDHADGETESHLRGANPHLYLSLDGAQHMIESIAASMQSLDPKYAEKYVENTQKAVERLDAQLSESRKLLAKWAGQSVILMNEALIYPALDYGLNVAEWIDRESGDNLVDSELTACLERLKAADARVILIEKQAPRRLVEALEGAGYAVARLDVLSDHGESADFNDYLSIQSANARAIARAFGEAEG